MKDMIMTDEMTNAMTLIENGDNVFVTGKAGTGKTTFLKYLIRTKKSSSVVAAPTGVAAINAGGVTLHSLFGFPFGPLTPNNKLVSRMSKNKIGVLKQIKTLIIDEISMVRPDVIDAIDRKLQYIRCSDKPFGGVQIVMFGDPFQLPPVVKKEEREILDDYYKDYFFFNANVWTKTGFYVIELNKVFRQKEIEFINVLNNIRNYQVSTEELGILSDLRDRENAKKYDNQYIHICTHKKTVESINEEQLGDDEIKQYESSIQGNFPLTSVPCDTNLKIRVGARIMALVNDSFSGYYNGMIGTVTEISPNTIAASMDNGRKVKFEKHTWSNVQYVLKDGEVQTEEIGSCTQFPITLAWAITIHKSQGLTFDKVALHISRTFCPGQLYVALSRCTSLTGIITDAFITKRMIIPEYTLLDFERAYKAEDNFYGRKDNNDESN